MKYSKHRRSRRLSKSRKSVNSQKRRKTRKLRKSQRRRKTRKISNSPKRRKTRKISKSQKRRKTRKTRKLSKSRESMKVMKGGEIKPLNQEHIRKFIEMRSILKNLIISFKRDSFKIPKSQNYKALGEAINTLYKYYFFIKQFNVEIESIGTPPKEHPRLYQNRPENKAGHTLPVYNQISDYTETTQDETKKEKINLIKIRLYTAFWKNENNCIQTTKPIFFAVYNNFSVIHKDLIRRAILGSRSDISILVNNQNIDIDVYTLVLLLNSFVNKIDKASIQQLADTIGLDITITDIVAEAQDIVAEERKLLLEQVMGSQGTSEEITGIESSGQPATKETIVIQ